MEELKVLKSKYKLERLIKGIIWDKIKKLLIDF